MEVWNRKYVIMYYLTYLLPLLSHVFFDFFVNTKIRTVTTKIRAVITKIRAVITKIRAVTTKIRVFLQIREVFPNIILLNAKLNPRKSGQRKNIYYNIILVLDIQSAQKSNHAHKLNQPLL